MTSLVHRRFAPGPARDYILPWDSIKPGDGILIACRVSRHQQDKNLPGQEAFLVREAKRGGAVVFDTYRAEVSGFDPLWLLPAVRRAKELGAKFLVADSTDRFVRHPAFKSTDKCKDLQARKFELEDLLVVADGLQLVTFLDPEAPPREVERHRSLRGQLEKGNVGGRPQRKKHRRQKLRPRAITMREHEMSYREISDVLKVPLATVFRWLKSHVSS